MATADSAKAKIQGLIAQGNAATGNEDKDLTTVVASLIAGFGQGGGESDYGYRVYAAQVTPETDASYLVIQHNLATTDILLAMCAANTLGDIIPTFGATLGKMWCKTGITNNKGADGFSAGYQWDATNNYAKVSAPNTAAYFDKITDDNTFTFNRCSSGTTSFLAGLTYDIIIIAANAGV